MKKKQTFFTENYSPVLFLSALGNGGLAVAFFMYLMFMVKHPDTPLPVFSDIYSVITGPNLFISILTVLNLLIILFFAFKHYKMLFINIIEYRRYKKTEAYQILLNTNNEVSLMVIPLTLAMSVNVLFILGAVFIPGLWNYAEILLPFALAIFAAIGVYALKQFSRYFSRLILNGDFDFNNNNLSQLMSSFAFIMIAVGFSSPAAMSHNIAVSVIGLLGAFFFGSLAILLLVLNVIFGFKSILKQGLAKENAPTLWIAVPIMTVMAITFVRVTSGISHNLLHISPQPVFIFIGLSFLFSFQIITGFIGYAVLKKSGYFKDYLSGSKRSASSYSLICPGVATFVLGMFFIHWGLVKTNILEIFSPVYFILLLPLLFIQFKTVLTLMRINRKLVSSANADALSENIEML